MIEGAFVGAADDWTTTTLGAHIDPRDLETNNRPRQRSSAIAQLLWSKVA
jgi:hypothetical protein